MKKYKLYQFELDILRLLSEKGYIFLARDKIGKGLFAYRFEVGRLFDYRYCELSSYKKIDFDLFFNFITREDGVILIKDILENYELR